MKRALTGIRTSGEIHIGNYLGAIKPAIELQKDYECVFFLADLHSLTTMRDPDELRKNVLDQVATWVACGFDYKKNVLFRQSDLPSIELSWYLACSTGVGFLEKAHAYKDAATKNNDVNVGVFYYPVLMAADILLYDADIVPVGKDQKQHVEMTRDMAGSVNAIYGENTLKLPAVSIREEVMTVPGLDGQKMSKSYNNTIPLMLPEKPLRKKVMSIITDSTALEDSKTMDNSIFGEFFKLFSSKEEYDDLEKRLNAGGIGWGHAKEELFQAINKEVLPLREHYDEIRPDEKLLFKILEEGREKAEAIANPVIERVRKALGIR